jgi:hypothetical protein
MSFECFALKLSIRRSGYYDLDAVMVRNRPLRDFRFCVFVPLTSAQSPTQGLISAALILTLLLGSSGCRLEQDDDGGQGRSGPTVPQFRQPSAPGFCGVEVRIVGVSEQQKNVVSSSPGGIRCPDECWGIFPCGSSVRLSAAPRVKNRSFAGWSGGCSPKSRTTCVVSEVQRVFVTAGYSP